MTMFSKKIFLILNFPLDFFNKQFFNFFYLYWCSVCMSAVSPGSGITNSCELPCVSWDLNLGPLEEQPVLSEALGHLPQVLFSFWIWQISCGPSCFHSHVLGHTCTALMLYVALRVKSMVSRMFYLPTEHSHFQLHFFFFHLYSPCKFLSSPSLT